MRLFNNLGKKDSFRHIVKSLANIYESTSLQFFRNTIGIQSGSVAFEESGSLLAFLANLEVITILNSLTLVLED